MAVGVSVALVVGCSDSVDPNIHGAPPGITGPASQIQIAPSSTALSQGGRSILRCAAFDAHGVMLSNQPVWTSSDDAVARVLSDGSVSAQRVGSTVATCQIGGRSATSIITVSTATIAFVEVSPGAGTIATGTSLQFSGVPRDSLGFPVPGSDVQWSSADTTIATVTQGGVVTARLSGDANIVATSAGVAGMTKVKVTPTPPPPVASISLNVDQTSLTAGHFTHATAVTYDANGQVVTGRSIIWSTSNASVLSAVTLNATKATVTGLAQGTATLTATSEGKSASAAITVGAPAVAIVATSLASPSILIGGTTLASAIPEDGFGNPLTGHTISWSSLDPTIATVSSAGAVTGVKAGAVIVRATCDGITGDATLTVTAAPVASVVAHLTATSLNVGGTTQATATVYDASGNLLTGRSVAWSSLNPTIATVSIAGLVTAVASGNAVIRATVESKTGDVTLSVAGSATPVTTSVVITFDSSSIAVGHTSQGKAVAKDAQGNVLTGKTPSWVSTTTGIAAVSSAGVVTGLSAGTPVIQASIDGVVGQGSLPITGSSTTTPGTTATVIVTLDSSTLAVGHTAHATARAQDAQGNALTGKTATWSQKPTGLVSFASTGALTSQITAVTAGLDTILATVDGIVGKALLTVNTGNVITAPAPAGAITANFDDGTFGPLYNPWGSGIDVPSDPTNLGHGKVARIHYSIDAIGQFDDNKALLPSGVSLGLGDSLWFQADFYLGANARMDASGPGVVQRKLLYWGTGAYSPQRFSMVLNSFGPQFAIRNLPNPSFEPYGVTYIPTNVANLTAGAWHRIKVQMRINTSFGAADGVLRIWYDGTLIFDHTNMQWTDPSWTDIAPSAYKWTDWGFGWQVDGTQAVSEDRYWDNVIFSRTPIP